MARGNLAAALRRVEQNAGAPGIDGVSTKELRLWLHDHWPEIRSALDAGIYRPQPVRRVMIPKLSGGLRKLGVPAAVDRLICQALSQVLTPIFDPQFHPHSFGYRPGRSAHQAVERARQFINDDAAWCADFDLDSFFDRVQHDALMARVARRVHGKQVLKLIRRYLEAGVMADGLVQASEEGTPQGSPLSPLLSNVMLDDLDWELERRGHYFVRYADDGVPRTLKGVRCRRRYRRMRSCMRDEGARLVGLVALRGRPAGGGRKPPRGAPVKSRGAERRGKGALSARQVWITKASESEPPLKCRKRIGDIQNRGRVIAPGSAWREPADWPGGCPA
jgi:group II intron reverse transcriptase/maturase